MNRRDTEMDTELRELNTDSIEEIKVFFFDIFTKEPWNDDWSDKHQLHAYIMDLIGNHNSLVLGLFENGTMVGLSMGSIRHWYSGTEYYIDEFCIKIEEQGRGLGTQLLNAIETFMKQKGMKHIFLQTERNVPAYNFYKKNGYIELENHVALVKSC
jgi:aminoglycoside 6'-N-acetyltransferase I